MKYLIILSVGVVVSTYVVFRLKERKELRDLMTKVK